MIHKRDRTSDEPAPHPHDTPAKHGKFRRAIHENIWLNLAIGVAFTVVMWGLATWVEKKQFYAGIMAREFVYDLIQHHLSASAPSDPGVVVVVVAGHWKSAQTGRLYSSDQPQDPYDFTDRAFLQKLVMAIADLQPKSIGLDIDFTPYPMQLDDDDRFLACSLARSSGSQFGRTFLPTDNFDPSCIAAGPKRVPIFVAAYTSIVHGPIFALARPEYSMLAAFAGAVKPGQNEAPRKMVYSIEVPYGYQGGQSWWVNSLSTALHGDRADAPAPAFSWAAERLPVARNYNFMATEFYVDYGPIENIARSTIPADDLTDSSKVAQHRSQIRDHFVLIGRDSPLDQHTVPGRYDRTFSGVFVHGCSVYTLSAGKLLALLLPKGRLILDICLFLVIIAIVEFTRWIRNRFFGAETPTGIVHLVTTVFVVILAVIGGIYLSSYFRILWDDSLFVGVALIAHSIVDHVITGV